MSPCLTPGPAAATHRQLLAHLGFEDALPPADGPPPADANAASLEARGAGPAGAGGGAAAHAASNGDAAFADEGARACSGGPRRLWPVLTGHVGARGAEALPRSGGLHVLPRQARSPVTVLRLQGAGAQIGSAAAKEALQQSPGRGRVTAVRARGARRRRLVLRELAGDGRAAAGRGRRGAEPQHDALAAQPAAGRGRGRARRGRGRDPARAAGRQLRRRARRLPGGALICSAELCTVCVARPRHCRPVPAAALPRAAVAPHAHLRR